MRQCNGDLPKCTSYSAANNGDIVLGGTPTLALPRATLCTLARNSFEAAFLDATAKAAHLAKVDADEAAPSERP